MARWLFKTEPGTYAFDDLEREGTTCWDGIRNAAALIHVRKVVPGDEVLVYHTGREKQVVGIARATSAAYADPAHEDERLAVVDIAPVRRLATPVPLAALRADESFRDFDLLRNSRLSAMPVPAPLWRRILKLGT